MNDPADHETTKDHRLVQKDERALAKKLRTHKGRRADRGESFISVPHQVYESNEFRRLSAGARALLLEFVYRYRGRNNGELEMTDAQYGAAGLGSRVTKRKYVGELLVGGWIVMTRQGGMRNGPNVYALTFRPLDDSEKGYDPPYRAGQSLSRLWHDHHASERDPISGEVAMSRRPKSKKLLPRVRAGMTLTVALSG